MWLYRLLLTLAAPFIARRIWRFHKRYDNYRVREALGDWRPVTADLWLHCASVGEVLAAKALIEQWLKAHPEGRLLVTTVTPTGEAQLQKSFAGRVEHRYLPLDHNTCVKRALRSLNCPQLAIIETELWPNLLQQAKAQGMIIQVINARLSQRSADRYGKFSLVSKPLMALPDRFLAHAEADAERFKALGAKDVPVVGNIKFDVSAPDDPEVLKWQAHLAPQKEFVWIAASTHEGEDEQFLEAHKTLQQQVPEAKLILVPRHPERFDSVYERCQQAGFSTARRSENAFEQWSQADVLLGDSMGEMMRYFAMADVAFVAGSMIERGGHNPIEPAVLAKPIIVGEHTFNFADITESLVRDQGACRVHSVEELVQQLLMLVNADQRLQMGQRALHNAQANQGALARVLRYLEV
ncbi:3-deoxy-D-manno-octulosonic acid transferase [Marinomonas ostreistagni]|uniref:3-deoxy-D-manno-octulosonic acid transferase n=1 Tax=Marinomonas ostreistagni TaxID=359209 RepID=UPI00194E43EB|nr:3-deoxy-D-manno-octulosonic acid transferase [Marinomonas ostreistagni]MBM6551220.1 3-deoxy-D-manno-octulosonic acid transferase [Marinomonas ostreistagni]